ncbi:MAG: ABC transporter substrate-binding protein [Rubrivivax sp.]|nr:MAG: ABC transporter substrate-binding protein [Rubrivivax sp.]
MRLIWALLLFSVCLPTWAAHAYAQFGDIKYPAGFDHFEYADPSAPKGGTISLVAPVRVSTFDKYNPFTLKGTAPSGLSLLVFETLLTGTYDEPTTAYGLLADDVSVAPDGLSATFRLNPLARFHNGDPVLALDVKSSFDRLMSKEASPAYRSAFGDVKSVTVLGERLVRFNFIRRNAELPLMAGALPVFSHKWGLDKKGQLKPFDKIVMDVPIASGPYRVGRVDFGKDITYQRDPNYWGRQLNVRKGLFNFDRITYRIYKDDTARLEAFKAGEFDLVQSNIAREWARAYTGVKFKKGDFIKVELKHQNAGGMQSWLFNTRRAQFKDARVRQAIGLAMDYEWMNRQLFYNSYTRVRGYFVGGDFEAKALPGADELALLEPLRRHLRPEVFTQPVPLPPSTSPPNSLRANLLKARTLLAQAGWTYRDGALRNAAGKAFEMEILDDSGQGASMSRIITPFAQNLRKLGIEVQYKTVDFSLLQKRLDGFDFDVTSLNLPGSLSPGAELLDRFGSKAAHMPGSNNFSGVDMPAVDALLDKLVTAVDKPQQIAALRALDRVMRFEYNEVPAWYSGVHRVAYTAHRFAQPAVKPKYYRAEDWILSTWWALPGK